MPVVPAVPAFGKPLNAPSYYEAVNSIIRVLRPHSTLRTIANHLNAQCFKTPSGMDWNRMHVANYLRNRNINTN